MTITSIDYVSTYFESPVLTKIHGEPTYETLQVIKNQLKANAASVTSDLGGGANGHLGLICTPVEYATVNVTPYVTPLHPGPLIIPVGSTQHAATRLREDHHENIRLYRESLDIKMALTKQIVQAIEHKYLNGLRNRVTTTITSTPQDILAYLFSRYGIVEDDYLTEQELKVRDMQYELLDPLVTMYDSIEDLEQLGIAANNPYAPAQLITFALHILKNTRDFEDGLRAWHKRPAVQKTWPNFKTHFEDEHRILRRVRGTTMRNTAYHQANMLASKVMEELQEVKAAVREEFQNLHSHDQYEDSTPSQKEEKANYSSGSDKIQEEILRSLKQM